MCGRYASARKRMELLEEFRIERDRVPEPLEPDYNVAPTKRVYAVLTRDARPSEASQAGAEAGSAEAEAAGSAGRAGRGPRAAGGPLGAGAVLGQGSLDRQPHDQRAGGDGGLQARVPAGVHAPPVPAARGRLLRVAAAGRASDAKRPGRARRSSRTSSSARDGGPLAFAGLYELWRDESVPDDHRHAWLWTATIITTSAPDELGKIHDRMPMVIEPERWADWLDPADSDPADLLALLAPAASGGLTSYPVSTAVNSVRNNGPQLIERIEPEALAGQRPSRSRPRPAARSPRSRSACVPRNLWQRPRQAVLSQSLNRPGSKDTDRALPGPVRKGGEVSDGYRHRSQAPGRDPRGARQVHSRARGEQAADEWASEYPQDPADAGANLSEIGADRGDARAGQGSSGPRCSTP